MTDEGYGYLELPPLPRQTIRQLDAAGSPKAEAEASPSQTLVHTSVLRG